MKRLTLLSLMLLTLAQTTYAQSRDSFAYNGQENQKVTLKEIKEITLYRTEMQDSTCTRQIPYTEEVCGNETFYRSECSWVPGRNHCYDESDYVCRNVTRHRQECTRGRSREECTTEPARRVCRTRNGVERCVDVPSRRRCRQVQGRETCRRVAYTDRQCETVTRRQCDWIPGQNECSQVPYQEWVCKDVTRYRDEQYACQVPVQIPYQADKEFTSSINFNFNDSLSIGDAQIEVLRNMSNEIEVKVVNQDNKTFIQKLEETSSVVSDNDESRVTAHGYIYSFGSIEKLVAPLKVELKNLWMNKAGAFSLKVKDIEKLKDVKIEISVKKKSSNSNHFKKVLTINDFKKKDSSLTIDLSNHGFKRLKGTFGKGVKITTEVKLVIKKPVDLVDTLDIKLEKKKSFSLKVYKNK